MHEKNIALLCDEADRLLQLNINLLRQMVDETAGSTSGTVPVRNGVAEKSGDNGRGRFGTEKRDGPD